MTRLTPKQLGAKAEQAAERYLVAKGLKLLTRNFNSRFGEVDLIMRDKKSLVFIEVRMRNNPKFGSAFDSVDIHKQQRLYRAACYYLITQKVEQNCPMRFDVIAVNSTNFSIEWLKNAFEVEW